MSHKAEHSVHAICHLAREKEVQRAALAVVTVVAAAPVAVPLAAVGAAGAAAYGLFKWLRRA